MPKPARASETNSQRPTDNHSWHLIDPIEIVAHEMRAPLAYVTAAGELLEGDSLTSTEIAHIGSLIRQRSKQLDELLNELLASLPSSNLLPVLESLDLSDLVADYVRFAEYEHPHCRFSLSAAQDHIRCRGTPGLTGTIVRNLLDNAARVSQRGLVTLTLERADQHVKLTVSDSGPGLSPQALEIIHSPSARPVPAERGDGHGLGLYICQELSHMIGARLTSDEKAEHGQVTLWLMAPQGNA